MVWALRCSVCEWQTRYAPPSAAAAAAVLLLLLLLDENHTHNDDDADHDLRDHPTSRPASPVYYRGKKGRCV